MTEEIRLTRDLTKWPRLLVVGEPVTEEQANDIIIRTSPWHWMNCNDEAWTEQVNGLAGITLVDIGYPAYESAKAFTESIGALDLEYLSNHRIMSCYLGGPHGWCDWSGRIGCSDYNIGKWPSAEEVLDEWQRIAAAFPYLRLRAQLVPNEGEANGAAVQFDMRDGKVSWRDAPETLLTQPGDLDVSRALESILAPGGERGVSLDRLIAALEQVRSTR